MYCIHCGTELPDEAEYCSNCGKPVEIPRESSSDDSKMKSTKEEIMPPSPTLSTTPVENWEEKVEPAHFGERILDVVKGIGSFILVIVSLLVSLFVLASLIRSAQVVEVIASWATIIGTLVCLIVLLPLALFRKTRVISVFGYLIASYVLGLSVWLFGLLVTYYFWGWLGIIIGLVILGVGVVPLGIIASAIHGEWFGLGVLVYGVAITFGARLFSIYLTSKTEDSYM